MMKYGRQNKILEIIAENEIDTQNQLIDMLEKAGIYATQATISRDIKDLRLMKELTPDGNYRYVAPAEGSVSSHNDKLRTIFRECVTSCVSAQNLVVIKTLPGLASAACSAIDKMEIEDLAGTLAGDDTAFIAMMTNAAAERFVKEISERI